MVRIAKTSPKELKNIAAKVRQHAIDMAYRSKTAELGSALSIGDILTVLYFRIMRVDPEKPKDPERDWFILSKGHGAATLYSALALRGYFPLKTLLGYRVNDGKLHGHPCSHAVPGVEVSTGSLGHGPSIAAGVALALREKKNRIYVLLGDGECNEGSVWEAAMFIATHNLNNVIIVIDDNKFQGFGKTSEVHLMDLSKKFKGFGWNVIGVNGHDLPALEKAFKEAQKSACPAVIIANTVAGKGVPHMENTLLAHYHVLNEKTYNDSFAYAKETT